MQKLNISLKNLSKRNIVELHTALEKLDVKVINEEITSKRIGETTTQAIKEIQKRNKLTVTGKLSTETIDALNAELFDIHHTRSKTRTEKLHTLLEKIDIPIPDEEKKNRIAGEQTRAAIKKFQKKNRLKSDGVLNEQVLEKLQEEVIKKTYTTKTQLGKLHTTLLKVNTIAKLEMGIAPEELKQKVLGPSSEKLIKAFQKRYKLPETGAINKATLDKLASVAASMGTFVKKIKSTPVSELATVSKPLRLNMVSPEVAKVQKNLSFLGYKIAENEFKTQTFGKTTIRAIKNLQKEKGLAQTGNYDKDTSRVVNGLITKANPRAVTRHRYRVRGSVRNELWQRKNNMVVKLFIKEMDREGAEPLGAKKVFLNGFFDIPYDAPINHVNGKVKDKFHLVVKLYEVKDQQNPVAEQTHYNVKPIHWVNFTESRNEKGEIEYSGRYGGTSDYEHTGAVLQKALGTIKIEDIRETETDKQITRLSFQSGLSTDNIMCHVLAHRVAKSVNVATLGDEIFFGFIRQNLPADLPGDLLRGTSDWETIDHLTELTTSGIVFLDDTTQEQVIDNAVAQNIVSQKVKINKNGILEELQRQRRNFTLTKPVLVGNGNLKSLLDRSTINSDHYSTVATIFINSKGVNTSFWEEIRTHEQEIGTDAINDFAITVETGNLTKNHLPTITFLREKTGSESGKLFKSASDIAKLNQKQLEELIGQNNNQVPDNMPGETVAERVGNFAAAIKNRAEFLYPAVSLVAAIKDTSKLHRVAEIESFIDEQKEFNLREHNVDKYLLDHPDIDIDDQVKNELKVVQRVHKITAKSAAGSVLIDAGLHSSMQIYFMGRDRLTNVMTDKGVKEADSFRLYESAKMQYMQVLARMVDYRREFNSTMPQAIVPHTYTQTEIQEAIGAIPDLEALFGSVDYCDCPHCRSLYSPSAYLTDMLRFLDEHSAIDASKTVKDILFERRPDLGNIKLNCSNTDTPLPYVDLVCEILENNLVGSNNFVYQTTLSQKELRAVPEYIQSGAYSTIATADFPMNSCFNLWQEASRVYLNYLRVPRYTLMEAFQDRSDSTSKKPADAAIAAEYFGISAKERDLIVTKRETATAQKLYWGFTAVPTSMAVDLFMKRTKLTYHNVLELLLVKFVNDPESPSVSRIERTIDTWDISVQSISNLTLSKFDLMHRFIRLWRKTGWEMWELDLLIRTSKVGGGAINDQTLINLQRFRQLQEKLKLPYETLLAFFGDINREIRVKPDAPDVIIQPLYNKLFQNQSMTNPVDKWFKGLDNDNKPKPLDNAIVLEVNPGAPYNGYTPVPTILSALTLQQTDFDMLVGKTDHHLSISTLSTLLRYAYLARSVKLSVTEFFLFLECINSTDPFGSTQALYETLEHLDAITLSGLSVRELDYILNFNPESPVGLRNESITQLIESLRKILFSNKEKIEQLKVSETDRNAILVFDVGGLSMMSTVSLIAALTPLQSILESAIENFTTAAFSIQETNSILDFDTTAITTASRQKLAENIEALQQNLSNVLNQNKNQIRSHIASSFGFADEQATSVLENCTVPGGTDTLLQALGNESLIARDSAGEYAEINATNFPDHFNMYSLLHKISLLVLKMHIETKELEFFIKNCNGLKTVDLSTLPVTTAMIPNSFDLWRNLYLFLSFKVEFPEPESASLRSILTLAQDSTQAKEKIFAEIAELTQWDEDEIDSLHAGLNLHHSSGNLDYTRAEVYGRLLECFRQMKLTGVDAVTMFVWADITAATSSEETISVQIRQALKSRYEEEEWLDKIIPLHNDIREKKRTALIEYTIEKSQRTIDPQIVDGVITNPLYWKDSTSLYKYFLIDTEMSACQLTSRIKQALSSIQLFVQRCFLNLENRYVKVTQDEKEDTSSPNAWSQWKWMKNYRIWEANRKIFFYPENWLEPELRDDKSPFFEELENELMQNEVTKDNVEQAFQNYLHKVDEVSHLEVCGMYHQMEDLNPDEAGYETNIVHVIGRTKAIPNIYYYRTYDMNYSTWSGWEKIDVDISGDQVTPVVYNRKLHLFWLQFMEKPMKTNKVPAAQPTNGPTVAPEPMKLLEVQLGWSVKKTEGWTTKKISKQKLIHPWERPHFTYNLKPYYLARFNELYLDIYLSTSREFNDTKFYDPNVKAENNPVYLTGNRFNETYLPWHSSSFIFDGEVKDVKQKGLGGHYNYHGIEFWADDSYDYVHEHFGEDGEVIKELDPNFEYGPRLKLPGGMHFHNTHLTNNETHSRNDQYLRVLENSDTTLLARANPPFELVITQQDLQLNTVTTDHPFFYQDSQRAFFVKPEWETRLNNYGQLISRNRKYRFMPFYHPYTMLFIRELNRDGIDGLLTRPIQTRPQTFAPKNTFNFNSYSPQTNVLVGGEESDSQKYTDVVDFSFSGANALYNWELFFHAPLMVACRLMQNQKFEDAMTWFHYIFDPTNIENHPVPQRYWITKPFFNYNSAEYRKQRIQTILTNVNLKENQAQLKAWRNNPFKPHIVARYRPVAYQKNVVMKYLDNLISWGDMLFKRDTIESINEASLLYMLAFEILGDRPQRVPNTRHEELTYNELETRLDEFGNARVDVLLEDTLVPITVIPSTSGSEPVPKLETFYFCIPNNDYLSKYWDTVEDRLFKIRHCMNIQGVVRQLPLFEPPIDPALLVKAAAAGVDLSSVLNDLAAPTPHYRFRIVVQKAIEFCNEVKILGEKLLSALERNDIEELSLLRSQHEIQMLEAVKEVRKKQVDEAVEAIGSLNKSFDLAEEKRSYYEGKPDLVNAAEGVALGLSSASLLLDAAVAIGYIISGGLKLIPDFLAGAAGFGGSPEVSATLGGQQIGNGAEMAVRTIQSIASALDKAAALSTTIGSYQHRKDDWNFLGRLAAIEKEQVQFQINAAMIRQAIAEKELENQELQIENAKTVDDYMQNKFTNKQLYSWMVTQIATVYFQAYQLAFDMAKKAEKCYQYELGISDSNIVQFGYWDSLKKGLLSGDKLMNDLRKLEAEYMNQNRREFEITKHISLVQMMPLQFITLKETGKCTISLPEWFFDMDYPGHYMRRIKNVSISIPCITGPFTGVNCTLSLSKSETRMASTLSSGNYEKQEDDTRFRTMYGDISSIATTHAQNDNGMFELNFNDERYLPFEGAGVISDWNITLPIENNCFDYNSLSDVILHISYTARNGGGTLATASTAYLQSILPAETARLFSLKHEFSTEWHRFLNPEGDSDQELIIQLKKEQFPFFIRGKLGMLKIKKTDLFVESGIAGSFTTNIKVTTASWIDGLSIDKDLNYNDLHHLSKEFTPGSPPDSIGEVRLKIKVSSVDNFKSLTSDLLDDIHILFKLGS